MATLPLLMRTVLLGLAFGVAFNPVASAGSTLLAALLYGSPRASSARRSWMLAVVAAAWLLGDGFRVMARLRDVLDGGAALVPNAPEGATLVLLVVWAAAGLAAGYALPALAAVTVGHGVVRGTGWLSAVVVGVSASLGLAVVAAPLSSALQRMAGG